MADVQESGVRARAAPNVLTQEEIRKYREDGFFVPQFRLSESETTRLRNLIAKLVADNPDKIDTIMNFPHVPGVGGIKSGQGWMEFCAHPVILDMVEQLVGPDIILRGSVVFYKRPGKGPATPWHRDAVTVPITPLETTSVWIAAYDTGVDNACLRYIPGSHKERERGKHRNDPKLGRILDESEYDESKAVDVELDAGQMLIFDIFAIHGSRPNLGTRERGSLAIRYMPATSHFDHDAGHPPEMRDPRYLDPSSRPLILVRGVDRAGNDFKRGHPS